MNIHFKECRREVLKQGVRGEEDYRIRAKKKNNLGTGKAGREKHQIFLIFIQIR